MSEVLLRVAVKAVITHKDKVLIVREAKTYLEGSQFGKYGLPGGRIEPNESFYDALEREVKEEVGLSIKHIRPVHMGEWWPEIKGVKNHIVAMFILCESESDKIMLSDEHDSYEWIDLEGLKKRNVMEPDRTAAFNYLSSLSE